MSKWKCDICNSEFNNFHAEGFEGKIYCPLCYYKHEYRDLQQQLSQLKQEKKELKEWLEEEIDKLENEKKEIKLSKGLDYSFALDDSINIYKKFLSKLKEGDK